MRQKRLARPCRTDQKNVALLDLYVVERRERFVRIDALVMIVDRDGQRPFRNLLTNDILVERFFDVDGSQILPERPLPRIDRRDVVLDDIHGRRNAEVANIDVRTRNDAVDLLGGASAERAGNLITVSGLLGHV